MGIHIIWIPIYFRKMVIKMIDLTEFDRIIKTIKDNSSEYTKIQFNFYNNIETFSLWKGNVANTFFSNISNDKISMEKIIEELENINKIIEYINKKYSEIGKKIKFNIDRFEEIQEKIINISEDNNNLNNQLDNIDNSFCDVIERDILEKTKNNINITNKQTNNSKEKIKNITNTIKEIETKIKYMISKIEIELIEEKTKEEYITPKTTSSDNDYYINTKELSVLNETLKQKIEIIENIIEDINKGYNYIIDNYKTKNTNNLKELFTNIIEQMNKLENNHKNSISAANSYIEKITKVNIEAQNIFDNQKVINGG